MTEKLYHATTPDDRVSIVRHLVGQSALMEIAHQRPCDELALRPNDESHARLHRRLAVLHRSLAATLANNPNPETAASFVLELLSTYGGVLAQLLHRVGHHNPDIAREFITELGGEINFLTGVIEMTMPSQTTEGDTNHE